MTKRHPAVVLILALVTCGIYHVYWLVATKGEMKRQGADIPTAWLLLIPFVNFYWLWKYSEGVEKVSRFSAAGAFVLLLLTGAIGAAIVQNAFNKTPEPMGVTSPENPNPLPPSA
jgi:hypothetical protein